MLMLHLILTACLHMHPFCVAHDTCMQALIHASNKAVIAIMLMHSLGRDSHQKMQSTLCTAVTIKEVMFQQARLCMLAMTIVMQISG